MYYLCKLISSATNATCISEGVQLSHDFTPPEMIRLHFLYPLTWNHNPPAALTIRLHSLKNFTMQFFKWPVPKINSPNLASQKNIFLVPLYCMQPYLPDRDFIYLEIRHTFLMFRFILLSLKRDTKTKRKVLIYKLKNKKNIYKRKKIHELHL